MRLIRHITLIIMKNNESLNSPDLSGADMTPEEFRLYRDILDAAYPKPKRDIKSGVMQVIREESAAVIIPAKEKKKERRRRELIKWGSLAASIVIVAGISIRVLPTFLSDNLEVTNEAAIEKVYDSNMQSTSGADTKRAKPETSYGTGIVQGLYQMSLSDSREEDIAVDDEAAPTYSDTSALDESASTKENANSADLSKSMISATAADAVEEEIEEDAVVESLVGSSAADESAPAHDCPHTGTFLNSYHEIPQMLIDEVGRDDYTAWANEVSREDSCAVNIYSFLQHFEISETSFVMYLQNSDINYYCDYPVNILYGSDADAVEAYYSSGGVYDVMVSDYFEYRFKLALAEELSEPVYNEWLGKFTSQTVRGWSIAQFVRDHELTEARFLEIYNETAEAFREEFDGCVLHEYNITKIFVPTAEIQLAISMSATGYQADLLCRK